ncbi:MAG: efflux RND transporter periplasmic adaptor subunit [Deltaproteobacteria bacterium]|nr:efflux RND transporter periplasmic adaptor subunit [Deltaproteobacteria bacterium]
MVRRNLMGNDVPKLKSKTDRLFFIGGVLIVLAALALVIGLWKADSHYLTNERSARLDGLKAGYRVRLVPATLGPKTRPISLVGDARPYTSVTLYSKVSGFLEKINVDKGDRVTEGQVLAVIESPELDRQYDAALADAKNKQADSQRARGLFMTGAMSLQDAERIETIAKVAENTAASLKAQKGYEVVSSPFTGIVTARYADPGALVQNAATAQTSALPIVSLAQIDRLRVYVYPDQSIASLVHDGDNADISDSARPDVKIKGTVTRTSGELDPKTRTLLVEIDVDNHENRILAGSSVQVTLWVQTPQYVEVPVEALLIRGDKNFVGVVTPDDRISFRPIIIYDSNGKVLRLSSGVKEGELVTINVRNRISDGDKVEPIKETPVEKNN